MDEIARVSLENEMDLILAHKRSMRLAELAGLSLAAQTTFATAVSEVSRNTIDTGKSGLLVLGIENGQQKYIVAALKDEGATSGKYQAGLEYAKRLVDKYSFSSKDNRITIELFYGISAALKLDILKLDEWRNIFRNEPTVSPYEELKRKNEQLQDLAARVQKSEDKYKILTNSLPLIIFSLSVNGEIIYANDWLLKLTGASVDKLNNSKWLPVIHEDDYPSFLLLLSTNLKNSISTIRTQIRIKNIASGEYLWHQVSLSPVNDEKEELQYWICYMADINAEKLIEELNRSNRELQQFAFVASHDLQEPIRKVLYYSDFIVNEYADAFDKKGMDYLTSIQTSAQRMRNLVRDLLDFSQFNKSDIKLAQIDLNIIAQEAIQDLEIRIEENGATLDVDKLPVIRADERMMRQLFENIIGNSLKYAKKEVPPVITISCVENTDAYELAFADNGIGFDEKYLPQMFTLFQRLHSRGSYEGTGLGLAICLKIADLHRGKIWAKSTEGEGATFYVSLPKNF